MDYQGLTTDDLSNINALNYTFLAAVSESRAKRFSVVAARGMNLRERARLATVPFLLFSFREDEQDYWHRLLDDNPQADLIDSSDRPERRIRELQAAGLGFLWQLARRNPYSVRLLCGAPVSWSEQLSRPTLIELLQRAAQRHDLLHLRFANDEVVWQRLLGSGLSVSKIARRASHHFALQVMLTRRRAGQQDGLSAAACAIRGTAQQSPRRHAGSICEPKV
jgi:hypothetical protein